MKPSSNPFKRIKSLAYIIVFLFSIILIFLGKKDSLNQLSTLQDFSYSLGIVLFGSAVLFFILLSLLLPDKKEEDRNEKLDKFLLKTSQNEYSSVFVDNEDGNFKDNLYKFFSDKIINAEHEISFSGDGFDSKNSKKYAEMFTEACKKALSNKVDITRLQTTKNISGYWAEYLKDLIKEDNFKLYLVDDTWSYGSICSIDSESKSNNVSEYMLQVSRYSKGKITKNAGLAVFIEKNAQLATDINDIIQSYASSESAQRVTLENFDQIMKIIKVDGL